MSAGVVVVAAGRGTRLGADGPKALVELHGRTLVSWAVAAVLEAGLPAPVVVHPAGDADGFERALDGLTVRALVAGGETRNDSVRSGVALLETHAEVVVIHDAARPLTPADVVARAVGAVTGHVVAAAPALQVADTLKHVAGERVKATVDRNGLALVQTPQVFRRDVLDLVLRDARDVTDELALVERALADGRITGEVAVVPGSWAAHKLTTRDDLVLLDALAAARG